MVSEQASITSGSKPNSPWVSPARAGEGHGDGKHVHSNSMASLHSPSAAVKSGRKWDSKSEDKGLSFFKSALKHKETRWSTGLGMTTLLSRKAGGGSTKVICKNPPEDKAKKGQQPPGPQQPNASLAGREQLISKDSASAKHSLLSARKSRSSLLEAGVLSPLAGRQPAEKPLKKLASNMPASAQPSQKPL